MTSHVQDSSVPLNWVLKELCGVMRRGTLLVVLDACRTVDPEAIAATDPVHPGEVAFSAR